MNLPCVLNNWQGTNVGRKADLGESKLVGPSPLSLDAEGNIYVATQDRTTLYVLIPLG